MKRIKYAVVLLLAAACLFSQGASALQTAPYNGYTYNAWGESVPAPAGYLPERVLYAADMGLDSLSGAQDLFAYGDRLFIADTGNNRVVFLDSGYRKTGELTGVRTADGKTSAFKGPRGVYMHDGILYVADSGNARVVACDPEGQILKEFKAPRDETLPDDFLFTPIQTVRDGAGYLYVLSENTFMGMLTYDAAGEYVGFYGSNKVTLSLMQTVTSLWKNIMSKEQRDKMERFLPVEVTNMYIDSGDFIYTVSKGIDKSADRPRGKIQMLNPMGENILRFNQTDAEASGNAIYPKNIYGDVENEWFKGAKIDSVMIDVHVDENDIISALDQERGRIFQYDQESNLLFVFGGIGQQKGNFTTPSALDKFGGQYVVLDAAKNSLTIFARTFYAEKVLEAAALYGEGLFEEAEAPWREVLRINSNNTLAYKSIGKAYLQREEYKEALEYLKMGQDRTAYSIALREYRKDFVREHFPLLLPAAAAGTAALLWLVRFIAARLGVKRVKTKIRYH